MTETEVRERAVSFARSLVGLGANPRDEEARERYIALIAPLESEKRRREMADSCRSGLVAAAIWRHVGVRSATLGPPFRVGSDISRLIALAWRHGAFVPWKRDTHPERGDLVLVGEGLEEHVYTVVDIEVGDAIRIESVDGGQKDANHCQIIGRFHRVWHRDLEQALNASFPDAKRVLSGEEQGSARPYLPRRIIKGWVDLYKLMAW